MYTTKDFLTKKALKEAVVSSEKVTIYQPGGIFNPPEANPHYTGITYLEGRTSPSHILGMLRQHSRTVWW